MTETRVKIHEEINDLIEELTTTGDNELDAGCIKNLKSHCKHSDENLALTFELLFQQLEKKHSEIRYSTFQVINQLFIRSHAFRLLVVSKLQLLFLLTVETNPDTHPLPLPVATSKKLKVFALRSIYEWYVQFGNYYRKLGLGYEFLKTVCKVRFSNVNNLTREQRRKEKEKKEKEERIRKGKLEQVSMQVSDSYDHILSNVQQIENCFNLLMPKVENDVPVLNQDTEKTKNENISENNDSDHHADELDGYGNETGIPRNYKVSIELSTKHRIEESADNTDIIENTRELNKELSRQLTTVKRWLHILVKCASKDFITVKKVLDLKTMMVAANEKYIDLMIVKQREGGDSDLDEFIDVPEALPSNSFVNQDNELRSTVHHEPLDNEKPGPSNASLSRKERLLKIAPVVPYDTDLQYWGDEKIPAPMSQKNSSLHRFWTPSEHEESFLPPQMEDALKTRKINLMTKFEPVTRKCHAPLPNGSLCERMDRVKCPFHGKIVDRNELGRAVDPRDAENDLKRKHEKERADREVIQKEIDSVLGTNLAKKKRTKNMVGDKSKARYARLTKIKNEKDSNKLEKKVLNNRALNKVYDNMTSKMRKRQNEKFSDNFNS